MARQVLKEQGFDKEMEALPYPYVEPGFILLAKVGEEVAGGVAIKCPPNGLKYVRTKTKSESEVRACEMKRMFVTDRFKGQGIGKMLAKACIKEASSLGYDIMVLDTADPKVPAMHFMAAAYNLYVSVGFKLRSPYGVHGDSPHEGQAFFELEL